MILWIYIYVVSGVYQAVSRTGKRCPRSSQVIAPAVPRVFTFDHFERTDKHRFFMFIIHIYHHIPINTVYTVVYIYIICNTYICYLVGGLEHNFYFSIQLGISVHPNWLSLISFSLAPCCRRQLADAADAGHFLYLAGLVATYVGKNLEPRGI